MSAGTGHLGPSAASAEGAANIEKPGVAMSLSQAPSKIVIRNTFIDVTTCSSTPSSPVTRSCPPSALIQPARPGPTLLPSLPVQRPEEAGGAQADSRRSPRLAAASKLTPGAAGAAFEQLTPTLSTASPGSRPLDEPWTSPLRPFDCGSALGGPQPPPWNPDLISELVANAAAMLENHTPTLSSASPSAKPLEAIPLSTPPYTPARPAALPGQLSPATPPGLPGAFPTHFNPAAGAGAPGEPDAKAMAHSFAAISSFAAIDEGDEECGGLDGPRGAGLEEDDWWRALEDPSQSPPAPPHAAPRPDAAELPAAATAEQAKGGAAARPLAPGERPPLPSLGSKGHFRKNCKPCAFLHTKGCSNGENCEFCHLCEAGEKKRRAKEKIERRRRQDTIKKTKAVQLQPSDVQPVLPVGEVLLPPVVGEEVAMLPLQSPPR